MPEETRKLLPEKNTKEGKLKKGKTDRRVRTKLLLKGIRKGSKSKIRRTGKFRTNSKKT
jgi:hypothetical protein